MEGTYAIIEVDPCYYVLDVLGKGGVTFKMFLVKEGSRFRCFR